MERHISWDSTIWFIHEWYTALIGWIDNDVFKPALRYHFVAFGVGDSFVNVCKAFNGFYPFTFIVFSSSSIWRSGKWIFRRGWCESRRFC